MNIQDNNRDILSTMGLECKSPFKLETNSSGIKGHFQKLFYPYFERITGLDALNDIYMKHENHLHSKEFLSAVLKDLNINIHFENNDALNRIPQKGNLVIVANHPFGALDGIIFILMMHQVRSDFKFIANYLLERIPQLREVIISIDPFKRTSHKEMNIMGMKAALKFLTDGGALSVFPSGEVSHFKLRNFKVEDPKWDPAIAGLIRLGKAPVLPIYFNGHNDWKFHLAGLINPLLRTLMLPSEFINKRNHTVHVKIGEIISYEQLLNFKTDKEMITHLRKETLNLKNSQITN